jgi:hypothetical protein
MRAQDHHHNGVAQRATMGHGFIQNGAAGGLDCRTEPGEEMRNNAAASGGMPQPIADWKQPGAWAN